MDTFEKNPATPQPEGSSPVTAADLQSLRQLVVSVLMLVLVVSGTLNIYLWRQYRSVRAELAPIQPQASQILAEANRVNAFAAEAAKKFLDFGRTHPDFMPILNKYGIRAAGPTGAPPTTLTPPATTPVPAPAPAPKK